MGEAEPEALEDEVSLRVELELAEPDSEVCALTVELALAVALDEDEGADDALAEGVWELEAEPDEVCVDDGGGLPDEVGVGLAEAVSDEDALREPLEVEVALADRLGADDPVAEKVADPEADADDDGLWDGGGLLDDVPVDVGDVETVALAD